MASTTGPGRRVQQYLGHSMSTELASTVFTSKWAETMSQRCMQSTQEVCLKERAEECSYIDVKYGWELMSFEDKSVSKDLNDEDRQHPVLALIKNVNTDEMIYVRSQYLVGCDGPSSKVSRTLKVKFDGFANLGQTRTIHIQAKGLLDKIRYRLGEALQYHISRPGYGVGWFVCNYFPSSSNEEREEENEKWTFFLMGLLDGRQPRQLSREDMIEVVHEFIGPDIVFDVVADAPWYWNLFFARKFVDHHVLICGDACHSWPPFGGIGGNTGYGDAQNLGWKLASIIHGWGNKYMLTSYDHERRQFGLKTIMTVLNFAPDRSQLLRLAILAKYPYLWWTFRYRWMFASRGAHAGNHYSTDGLFLGIQYHSNIVYTNHHQQGIPSLESPPSRYSPAIYAGGRLPHIELSKKDHKSIYDTLAFDGYTLLLIDPISIQLKDFHKEATMRSLDEIEASSDKRSDDPYLHAPIVVNFLEYFHKRKIPLKVVNIAPYLEELKLSPLPEDKLLYHLYHRQHLILVRPDFIITWFLSKQSITSPTIISIFEILKVAKISCAEIVDEEMMRRNKNRDHWLTRRFISNIQGYRHLHKQAIYFENEVRTRSIYREYNIETSILAS